MVYMMSLPGGWIADRLIGQRRAVLYGGILIACGHFRMAIPVAQRRSISDSCSIVLGTGLLKPNISVIVGQLYPEKDIRRDAGLLDLLHGHQHRRVGPLITGYLAQTWLPRHHRLGDEPNSAGTGASARPASG